MGWDDRRHHPTPHEHRRASIPWSWSSLVSRPDRKSYVRVSVGASEARECLQQRTDLPLAGAPLRRSGSQICAVPHARPPRPAVRCSPIQGSAPEAGGTRKGILLFPILCTSERAYGRKNWPATRTVLARDQRHSGRRRLRRRAGTTRQALSCSRPGAGTAAGRVHDACYLQVRLQAPSGPARRPAPRERAGRDCPRRPQRGKPEKARKARDRLR